MTTDGQYQRPEQEGWLGGCILWFFWGISLSFMTILSLALLVGLVASVALNVYLGWQLSGLEVSVSRRSTGPIEVPLPIPTGVLAAIPTTTPTPTRTPMPPPTESPLTIQLATLSAIATRVAAAPPGSVADNGSLPAATPIAPTPAIAIGTPAIESEGSQQVPQAGVPTAAAVGSSNSTPVAAAGGTQESAETEFVPPKTSSNRYSLIPIEGQRESRPPAEHGDLNLKLREPQPSQVDPGLVEISGSGIDPDAPKLSASFGPDDIIETYAVHDWDWGCNCKGDLLPEDEAVLISLKTVPGEPVFIPETERDIYEGRYVATLLYADEDSLTFVYARAGSVVSGYTVHFVGLHTDPNLIALFEESKVSELPGLTLDTPVGVAGDELLVAIRDNGKFLDARSKKDWWE